MCAYPLCRLDSYSCICPLSNYDCHKQRCLGIYSRRRNEYNSLRLQPCKIHTCRSERVVYPLPAINYMYCNDNLRTLCCILYTYSIALVLYCIFCRPPLSLETDPLDHNPVSIHHDTRGIRKLHHSKAQQCCTELETDRRF